MTGKALCRYFIYHRNPNWISLVLGREKLKLLVRKTFFIHLLIYHSQIDPAVIDL